MNPLSPNDLGKRFLVEECQKISISIFLRKARIGIKEKLINSELSAGGITVGLSMSKTILGGVRYWFSCPICRTRRGVIYVHPLTKQLGCRKCLGLEYRQIRYKGMLESSIIK